MAIDRKTVENVAKLARLQLSGEELAAYEKQLGAILEYVGKLETLQGDVAQKDVVMPGGDEIMRRGCSEIGEGDRLDDVVMLSEGIAQAHVAADDVVSPPVSALDENIRLKGADDRVRRFLLENHNTIDARQRQQDFSAFALGVDRPVGALDAAHRRVGVQADHQAVAKPPGRLQGGHVPGMQQVEAAAGGHDGAAAGADPTDHLLGGQGRSRRRRPRRVRCGQSGRSSGGFSSGRSPGGWPSPERTSIRYELNGSFLARASISAAT